MRLTLGLFIAACSALAFPCIARAQQVISDPNIIHSQYHANKISALDRYNNKNYIVVGIVDDVEMGYVQIDSRVPLGGSVYCRFTNSIAEISRLRPNQRVYAAGRLVLTGKSMGRLHVDVMGCRITPQ